MPCATPCKNCDRKGLPILFVRYAAAYSAQTKGMNALKQLQPMRREQRKNRLPHCRIIHRIFDPIGHASANRRDANRETKTHRLRIMQLARVDADNGLPRESLDIHDIHRTASAPIGKSRLRRNINSFANRFESAHMLIAARSGP